jgi:hypothetical protein
VRYWALALGGLLLVGAALVAGDWAIYHLARTGTCASGGPYVSARPCPAGTGTHIVALLGGIFGVLIGTGIYAMRGGSRRPSPIGLGTVVWSLGFLTSAGAVALAAYGPANNDDDGARTAAIVIACVFVPLALAPLFLARGSGRRAARALDLTSNGRKCSGEVTAIDDTGVTINNNPRVHITVRAEPPGEPAFTIERTSTVSRVNLPRVGDRATVLYDPADREHRNLVTFEQAGARAENGGDDPLAEIERLGKLRDQGLVTPQEFEEHKRRLLDQL